MATSKKLIILLAMLPLAVSSWALDLQTVLELVGRSGGVQTAEAAVAESAAALAAKGYAGDVLLAAQPDVEVDADEVTLRASVSTTIPLTLSDTAKSALELAALNHTQLERRVDYAADRAYLDLFVLYRDAWVSQENYNLAETASAVAKATLEVNELLFDSGQLSFNDYMEAVDDTKAADDALATGFLNSRLTWIELASALDLDWKSQVDLDSPDLDLNELPRPSILVPWSEQNHPDILDQQASIDSISEELAGLESTDLAATFRASFSAASHNVSASYNTTSAVMSANYSFPVFTFGGSDTSQGQTTAWSVGISANVALDVGREQSVKRDALLAELSAEYLKLSQVKESVALEIRNRYQEYLLAGDAVISAQRTADRASTTFDLMKDKYQLGQITESELDNAEISLKKALLQVDTAKVSEIRAALSAAHAAAYLGEYVQKEDV